LITRRQFIKLCASSIVAVGMVECGWQLPTSCGTANQQIPVLLYHRVGYTSGQLTVTPERFARDLRQLKNDGYTTISLRQFEDFLLDHDIELPEKPVLITFDDGYRDNYENAFPILSKQEMKATFFIISGMIGAVDRVTEADIREMSQRGMAIGSHTVSHRPLGDLPLKEMQQELFQSRYTLEDIIGTQVDSISYPRGSYNYDTIQMASDFGYISGFTTLNGSCSKTSPLFVLRRIPVFSYDGEIFGVMAKRGIV
jgi:peptidoglycan/xylan/chitin deacetylase (PgdA/CDA1 family)